MEIKEVESAWFKFEAEMKKQGLLPGAFTAFKAGYEAGKDEGIAQGVLDGYDAGAANA
jgi:flagellar biosynthesis/type III secretory pathway protein FliH